MTVQPESRPSVAVVDHEVVRCGVQVLLAPFAESIELVRTDPGRPIGRPVDIVLADSCSRLENGPELADLVADPHIGTVVLYTWALLETVVVSARRQGIHAALPKSLDGEQLARALVAVHLDGARASTSSSSRRDDSTDSWPGREAGLTHRESEVISLVTSGLSNDEIAARTYLSINSVKSYIRSAYRAMGVTTRSQALLWGIDNGMAPTRMSLLLPPAS
jgi:DNA-binding NarL/FixJ family response regulator